MQPPSINTAVSALRFLFTVTLDRPDLARRLTVVRQPRRLPAVLSVEEVTLLLHAAPGPKYKAAFATAYGAGLRVSEVVALRVGDVDSERMLLRIERGKGARTATTQVLSMSRTRATSKSWISRPGRTDPCRPEICNLISRWGSIVTGAGSLLSFAAGQH
jgi:integrase